MIVDAHAHLLPKKLADAIGRWFKEHAGWDVPPVDVGEAIRTLREGRVDRVVTLPYVKQQGMARNLNADILKIAQDHHPYIVPCCTVHPDDKDAGEILEEALKGPFAGVKIHCHVMGVAPDDARLA